MVRSISMPETWANTGGSGGSSLPAGPVTGGSGGSSPRAGAVGIDLHLHLDMAGSRVRVGLEAALRDAVRAGRLGAGTRLPSSRDLAADLGIARNTVADAYGQLVAEGWLEARTGSGTWVTARPAPAAQPHAPPARGSAAPRYD